MNTNKDELIVSLTNALSKEAADTFTETQLESLRVVIRFTVDFRLYLESIDFYDLSIRNVDGFRIGQLPQPAKFNTEYCIETIFAGVDFFREVAAAYCILVGATESDIQWDRNSMISFKDLFIIMFDKMVSAQVFEIQCRALLDLFKMQIVFAGLLFG